MSVPVQNHWFFSCYYCYYGTPQIKLAKREAVVKFLYTECYLGFELSFRSMDFPADITLKETRMKFELTFKVVLLFNYQGFKLSLAKAFIFYHITLFLSRTFLKTFFIFFQRFLFFAMRIFICYHMFFQSVKKFFRFLLGFLSFFFQKCVSHVQCVLYYHNSVFSSSIF